MTTNKTNRTLNLWLECHPTFIKYKSFLIRQHGCLLLAIAINTLRNSNLYVPTFLIHNLLSDSNFISLSYDISPKKNNVRIEFPHGENIEIANTLLSNQVNYLDKINFSYEDFLKHIEYIYQLPYGAKPFLPHTLFDILTTGSFLGFSEQVTKAIPKAIDLLHIKQNRFNMNIIGSIAQWEKNLEDTIANATISMVEKRLSVLGINAIQDYGLYNNNDEIDYASIWNILF